MGIDPAARGLPSTAHVSLHEAGQIARSSWSETGVANPAGGLESGAPRALGSRASRRVSASQRSYEPHTAIRSSGATDPGQWDGMLNRLGAKYNVPPMFLKAVMLAESGGRPDAVGDDGHSVGLFQLHDQGYGHGMGDARYDPEVNAERATRGLAEAWHAGQRAGYTGEFAVRAAYDYSFNPGGGFAYQGDSVVRYYNALLADQGLPSLA